MSELSPETTFDNLIEYLIRVPSIETNDTPSKGIGRGVEDDKWWVKFSIDIDHDLSWWVVQEFGHVLNYLSLETRLSTTFKPVSPPPYMNGGPSDFLSWVIEGDEVTTPDTTAEWLEGRLPRPVEDETQWAIDD